MSISVKDRVVVITGASSGIGAVVAEKVGQKGGRAVLLARREPELHEVARRAGNDALVVVAEGPGAGSGASSHGELSLLLPAQDRLVNS